LEVFPEVDLYWILNGKGSFPKTNNLDTLKVPSSIPVIESSINTNLFSEVQEIKNTLPVQEKITEKLPESVSSEIEKIVFFYKNGTFKEFKPN
jgi:hypothetical protein